MNSNVDYVLLEAIDSVHDFLKLQFGASSQKIKKYFDHSFLKRSFKKGTTLTLPINFVNEGMINPIYEGKDVSLLYEDETFLVLDKPENIFVHPLTYEEKNNCLSYLRSKRPEVLMTNVSHYDRGLLYRLDFETSGVLVFLKPPHDVLAFRENFHQLVKTKNYRCWVEGEAKLKGEYVHYFASSEIKGRRIKVFNDPKGEAGKLSLNVIRYCSKTNCTLIEVELVTGLRHQIRAQLSHLGHPLRGDEFYGAQASDRLYLHACDYRVLWMGKEFKFSSQHPDFN